MDDFTLLLRDRARRMRNAPTPSEAVLWCVLKGARLGASFRRQYVVNPYILDFYAPAHHLAVELDGAFHHTTAQRREDEARTDILRRVHGIHVLRFTNQEVRWRLDSVTSRIRERLL